MYLHIFIGMVYATKEAEKSHILCRLENQESGWCDSAQV